MELKCSQLYRNRCSTAYIRRRRHSTCISDTLKMASKSQRGLTDNLFSAVTCWSDFQVV